jgi:CO dehydrogenase/acetyl-CoA synthase alpha subunit
MNVIEANFSQAADDIVLSLRSLALAIEEGELEVRNIALVLAMPYPEEDDDYAVFGFGKGCTSNRAVVILEMGKLKLLGVL